MRLTGSPDSSLCTIPVLAQGPPVVSSSHLLTAVVGVMTLSLTGDAVCIYSSTSFTCVGDKELRVTDKKIA